MKAIYVHEAGGVENLVHTQTEIPEPKTGEVLVKVKAISVNPVDVKARAYEGVLTWIFGDQRPVILGWDISGEIVSSGEDTDAFEIGDQVFAMANFLGHSKAYAEYVTVPAHQLALKPDNISHEEAAAATLAALTAWQVLVTTANIQRGQKVLIHAGSGGVGHFAVQIAKHLGAYVIATSSAKNKDFVLGLGADEHIDYQTSDFSESLNDMDLVIDAIGGDVMLKSVAVVKASGRIITLPGDIPTEAAEAAEKASVDLSFMLVESNGEDMKSIAQLLEQQTLKSHVSASFDFADMDKAHLQVETGRTVGKVIVTT
ncbi:NADP-dependent oxidoreductase [Leucothrix arctica]|uniref:Oxidoreductase n=1 Tax=Leucothrix arctica TaxID=1481894 RepID=A0A317CCD2_9GAMM|nr:NADP-dependent oxidoreductase [Leucothrix arctica]PWQ96037.1 oxidoreductase [Leucothrix arctica]